MRNRVFSASKGASIGFKKDPPLQFRPFSALDSPSNPPSNPPSNLTNHCGERNKGEDSNNKDEDSKDDSNIPRMEPERARGNRERSREERSNAEHNDKDSKEDRIRRSQRLGQFQLNSKIPVPAMPTLFFSYEITSSTFRFLGNDPFFIPFSNHFYYIMLFPLFGSFLAVGSMC